MRNRNACEIVSWISVKFNLYLIKEFHRIKEEERKTPGEKGNIRYQATSAQLVCLANPENLNAFSISEGLTQSEQPQRLDDQTIGPDSQCGNGGLQLAVTVLDLGLVEVVKIECLCEGEDMFSTVIADEGCLDHLNGGMAADVTEYGQHFGVTLP